MRIDVNFNLHLHLKTIFILADFVRIREMKIEMKNRSKKVLNPTLRKILFVINKKDNLEKIKQFRKTWLINDEGFKSTNDWQDWGNMAILNSPVKLTSITIFETITECEFFDEHYRCNKPKPKTSSVSIKENKTKLFNANFDKAASILAKDIGMDGNLLDLFRNYLWFGDRFLKHGLLPGIYLTKVSKGYEKNNLTEEQLILIITPNTSKKDIIRLWRDFIEKERKKMAGYIDVPSGQKVDFPK